MDMIGIDRIWPSKSSNGAKNKPPILLYLPETQVKSELCSPTWLTIWGTLHRPEIGVFSSRPSNDKQWDYPLENIQKAIENGHL